MYIKVLPTTSLVTCQAFDLFLWWIYYNLVIIKVIFTYHMPTNYVKHVYAHWLPQFNWCILIVDNIEYCALAKQMFSVPIILPCDHAINHRPHNLDDVCIHFLPHLLIYPILCNTIIKPMFINYHNTPK